MTSTTPGTPSLAESSKTASAPRHVADTQTVPGDLPEGPRRWLSTAVAAVMLLLTFPFFALVAVVIKLTSPGPVFYTQTRIGKNRRWGHGQSRQSRHRTCDLGGQPFVIYKFRTMRMDAERETGAVWATKDDPRVTLIGKILRQSRLDELPQLINVLRGEMNIVGPRPERPSIFARLADELEAYPERQRVRPGITGLAQISQQYDASLDDVRRKLE